MNLIQHLNPSHTPAHISRRGELMVWRERILQTMLLLLVVSGVVIYLLALQRALSVQDWTTVLLYSAALAATLVLTFIRVLPFGIRTGALLLIIYILAIQNLVVYGVTRNSVAYMVTIIFLAGLLLGIRQGFLAILVTSLTVVGMGYGMNYGGMSPPLPETLLNSMQFNNWINVAVNLSLAGTFMVASMYIILNGLQTSLFQLRTLTMQLNASRLNLEKNVEQRTADLQRRLIQIRTATDIARSINTVLDPDTLLQQVVDSIHKEFNLYYVGIFLVDLKGEYAVLKTGSGEAGKHMLALGHRLAVGGNSMIGWATARKEARIALDTGAEAVRFNNPHLPLTRSEIALPIVSRNTCLGALTIQSTEPEAFDEDDIRILLSIADSIAIALENARLFQQTQQNLEEIRSLNRAYLAQSWKEVQSQMGGVEFSYQNPLASGNGNTSNQVHLPLTLRDQAIGNLTLDLGEKNLSPEEVELIDGVVSQTAIALENARLIQETQRRAFEEQHLSQMTAQFSRANTVEQILKTALREIGSLPNIAEVSVQLIPPQELPLEEVQR